MTESHSTDVVQLLAVAGPRDAVPAERLERMRAAVHDAWTAETKPRATRAFVWTIVTATAVATIFALIRMWPVARIKKPVEVPVTARAIEIKTGPSERKSLRLSNGGELRVDASSVVTLTEGREIRISKGAVYLDSKGKTLPAVVTPAGRITDTGTRFEVRVVARRGGAATLVTRVRVRDGKVGLAQASSMNDIGAAEELLARADGSTARRHVDPFGAEWAWVTRAAPRLELEGTSLGSFLDWVEREGAWTVRFASPALERRARSTVLHGSVEHMSTTEALDVILLACGLSHRVDLKTGRVTVTSDGR
jgi:ferric-dicitrate binding protein FerR (iron transport regulator)